MEVLGSPEEILGPNFGIWGPRRGIVGKFGSKLGNFVLCRGDFGRILGPNMEFFFPQNFPFKFLVIDSTGMSKSCQLHHFIESKRKKFWGFSGILGIAGDLGI